MQETLTIQLTQGQDWPESEASLYFVPWVSASSPQSPGYDIYTLTHMQYSPLIQEHTVKKLL